MKAFGASCTWGSRRSLLFVINNPNVLLRSRESGSTASRQNASNLHRTVCRLGRVRSVEINPEERCILKTEEDPLVKALISPSRNRLFRAALVGIVGLFLLGLFAVFPAGARAGARTGALGLATVTATSGGAGEALNTSTVLLFSLLFIAAAALAAAETAITTLWPWKVRKLASEEGDSSMFTVLENNLTRFLTTILIATTVATIFTTAVATEVASAIFGGKAAVAYVTAGLTLFFLFFGEILPKSLAVHNAERVLRVLLPFVSTLSVILYPIGKILAFSANLILRLFNLYREEDAPVSEEELRLMIAGADRSGTIEPYESKLISNVLDLEEIDVRDVMCPRVDMVALPSDATLRDFLSVEEQYHFSRVPIFQGTTDNIIGVMHAKSLLKYLGQSDLLDTTKVEDLADAPYFVPESVSAWSVLEQMRLRRLHLAVVVDEYGGTAGLVTLEDILEEVVGEIYDEDDDIESEESDIVELQNGSFFIDGQAELEKVAEALLMELPEDDLAEHGTISGFLCNRLEGIPSAGELVTIDNVEFKIVTADDRRILTLEAARSEEEPESSNDMPDLFKVMENSFGQNDDRKQNEDRKRSEER
ncbi:hypothetical protein NDN08_003461 [Rhodosorus marinus]|uniref:HlyC/CorC family transporter n=1 Tax=Rhodosorus marinus TaxID=101924 RepID=A0AAV8UWK1_9RHOD|nr:hypothetical protein NDN08_003461 [Rhodosorus marinus]